MVESGNGEVILIGIFSVLMGMIAFAFSGSMFNIFFVPVVIAVLWDYSNKMNSLMKKLADLESKLSKTTAPPSP